MWFWQSRLLIDLVTVLAIRRKKYAQFFSVGFKYLSHLLAASLKSWVFITVQEQLSPFSPGKLLTRQGFKRTGFYF